MAIFPRLSYYVCGLFGAFQCKLSTFHNLGGVHLHLTQSLHSAHIFKYIHADTESGSRKMLLFRRGVNNWLINPRDVVKSGTHRNMVNINVVLAFWLIAHWDLVLLHAHFRETCVFKR